MAHPINLDEIQPPAGPPAGPCFGNSLHVYLSALRVAFERHGVGLGRWLTCVPKTGWRVARSAAASAPRPRLVSLPAA